MPFTKPIIDIVNVVATATIDQKLDLYKIKKNSQIITVNSSYQMFNLGNS